MFATKKLKGGLPYGEKSLRIMFARFDTIHERDGHQKDGQTPCYGEGRACSLARL